MSNSTATGRPLTMQQNDKDAGRRFFTWHVRLADVLRDLATASAIGALAGFAGRWHWMPDLFAHFQLQYLVILAPAAVLLFLARRRRVALVCALCAAVTAAQVVPLYRAPAVPAPAALAPLRVLEINVLRENGHGDEALRAIRDADADLVLAMEVTEAWMRKLEVLRDAYPHVLAEPQEDCFGIAFFSKWPLRDGQTLWPGFGWVPMLRATMEVRGRAIDVVGAHAIPPVSGGRWDARNAQLREIANLAAARERPMVVVGDLNITPWSWHFRELLRGGGLVDSARGFGVQGTWISFGPSLLRIPIDHVLVSPEFRTTARRVGSPFGSDHLPLVVDLAL